VVLHTVLSSAESLLPCRWRQLIFPKHWYPPIRQHCFTTHKTSLTNSFFHAFCIVIIPFHFLPVDVPIMIVTSLESVMVPGGLHVDSLHSNGNIAYFVASLVILIAYSFIHSFRILSYKKSIASSKASFPMSAI
jgi:hypothetical protein